MQDGGPGIPCETIEKIFDPFFTTKGTEGTGLGLPQVRAFVSSNHGLLTVKSDPAHGTAVNLLFPPYKHSDEAALNGAN